MEKILIKIKSYFKVGHYKIQYFFERLEYLKIFWSPFIRPKLKLYCGKVAIGTPYFFPRKWIKASPKLAHKSTIKHIKQQEQYNKNNPDYARRIKSYDEIYQERLNYLYAVPKRFGFDFVGLGWKTKWSDDDIRFEHGPVISFVFFKWQIALQFKVVEPNHYWSAWIYYSIFTDKNNSPENRLKQAIEKFPMKWIKYNEETKQKINYWNLVLKPKYLYLIPKTTQDDTI